MDCRLDIVRRIAVAVLALTVLVPSGGVMVCVGAEGHLSLSWAGSPDCHVSEDVSVDSGVSHSGDEVCDEECVHVTFSEIVPPSRVRLKTCFSSCISSAFSTSRLRSLSPVLSVPAAGPGRGAALGVVSSWCELRTVVLRL
jgi:hypothetical protein